MTPAAVDGHLLLRMAWTALAAGICVSLVFSLGVYGVTRSGDRRRDGRSIASAGYALLGTAGLVATVALIVYGLILLARKS